MTAMFALLGSGPVLAQEEEDVSAALTEAMEADGVALPGPPAPHVAVVVAGRVSSPPRCDSRKYLKSLMMELSTTTEWQ